MKNSPQERNYELWECAADGTPGQAEFCGVYPNWSGAARQARIAARALAAELRDKGMSAVAAFSAASRRYLIINRREGRQVGELVTIVTRCSADVLVLWPAPEGAGPAATAPREAIPATLNRLTFLRRLLGRRRAA